MTTCFVGKMKTGNKRNVSAIERNRNRNKQATIISQFVSLAVATALHLLRIYVLVLLAALVDQDGRNISLASI